MSNEMNETKHECKCFCHSDFFKKFATITLGTFVGGFCAISLFAALNKPPMPVVYPYAHPGFYPGYHHSMHQDHQNFGKPKFASYTVEDKRTQRPESSCSPCAKKRAQMQAELDKKAKEKK